MKKVLAWAVVLALVLSSFTMAFAADTGKTSKDFSDADQIQYTEAVDVMVATGIINGFPDGTFGPQKTVTRSQMAKMIACIKNGGEDVGDQYKSACPFKDSQKHWAAGYIAYCASEHIIDGRSADVFDPDADVTGTEVAKMALTTLGYDSKIQGYTGETWAAAVLKDAKKVGLFEGLDKSFVPGDPCSREAAAQILFNMLKATEVEYTNGTSVAIGDDISVVVASDMKNQTWSNTEKPKYDDNGDGDKQLYEDVFGGKLSQNKADKDDFGRPAHSWTYPDKKTEVGEYVDSADYEFTATAAGFNAAVKAYDEDLAKELTTGTVKVNGTSGTVALGDKVELFVKSDNTYEAVVTQYKPARITKVNTNVKENKDGITAELTLEGAITKANNKMAGYNESTYVEGAVIAVALGQKNAIMDSYVMEEAAKGEVTKKTSNPVKYTVDGKEFETSSANYVPFDEPLSIAKDKVFVLYDYNGYVLASALEPQVTPVTEKHYGVIANYKKGTESVDWDTETGADVFKIQMFTSEGEFEPLTVNAKAITENKIDVISNNQFKPKADVQYKLVTYTLNEDGEIDSITTTSNNTGINGKKVKEGTLNGYDVAADVAVFDIYKEVPATGTADATIAPKEQKDWAVLGLSDLEEAEAIYADSAIQDEKVGYVAMLLHKPLTEEVTTEDVLGFVSGYSEFSTQDGAFATISFWKDGTEESYTTAKEVYGAAIKATGDNGLQSFAADDLAVITLNKDGEAINIAKVTALAKENKPVDKFTDPNKAAVYTSRGTEADGVVTEDDYTVVAKATTTQLVFGVNKVDKQPVSKATVYELKGTKLVKSALGDIQSGVSAKIYQLNAESGVWNVVIYKKPTLAVEEATMMARTPMDASGNIGVVEGFEAPSDYDATYAPGVISIKATNVPKHLNGNPDGQVEGYWVGVKITGLAEGTEYSYSDRADLGTLKVDASGSITKYYNAETFEEGTTITIKGIDYTVDLSGVTF